MTISPMKKTESHLRLFWACKSACRWLLLPILYHGAIRCQLSKLLYGKFI